MNSFGLIIPGKMQCIAAGPSKRRTMSVICLNAHLKISSRSRCKRTEFRPQDNTKYSKIDKLTFLSWVTGCFTPLMHTIQIIPFPLPTIKTSFRHKSIQIRKATVLSHQLRRERLEIAAPRTRISTFPCWARIWGEFHSTAMPLRWSLPPRLRLRIPFSCCYGC